MSDVEVCLGYKTVGWGPQERRGPTHTHNPKRMWKWPPHAQFWLESHRTKYTHGSKHHAGWFEGHGMDRILFLRHPGHRTSTDQPKASTHVQQARESTCPPFAKLIRWRSQAYYFTPSASYSHIAGGAYPLNMGSGGCKKGLFFAKQVAGGHYY